MNSKTWLSRRNVLRGLGVGLALPWLESLSLPAARAETASPTKRYLFMYFSCGVARAYWPPKGAGAGDAWQVSALLAPLEPYKQYVQVVSNIGQEELYNSGLNPNPSHSLYCAPSLSCTVPDVSKPILGGPTVDQVIAQRIGAGRPFKSLQVGCSTMNSSNDGRHPSMTRSISWAATDQPLYKEVNPQAVFDSLVMQLAPGGGSNPANQALAQLRKDRDISVLDYVNEEATALSAKLSSSDRRRLDQFLTSVQDLESRTRLQGATMPATTKTYTRPAMAASYNERRSSDAINPASDPAGYNRDTHAELMNDLIQMAFETDLTRVVSHMLDDARSDYHYNFLKQRKFSGTGSVEVDAPLNAPLQGSLLGYHGLSHDGDNNDGYATVNYWFVQKFASLLGRLSTSMEPDGSGKSVLDNTIVVFMSGMQGSSHELTKLPVVIASGGSVLKANYHNNFPAQVRLADMHLTIMQKGFGLSDITKFGYSGGTVDALLV